MTKQVIIPLLFLKLSAIICIKPACSKQAATLIRATVARFELAATLILTRVARFELAATLIQTTIARFEQAYTLILTMVVRFEQAYTPERKSNMIITDTCVACLYDKELNLSDNEDFLREIRELLDNRDENATAPYMVYLFDKIYRKYFGELKAYDEIKKQSNDFVLEREEMFHKQISASEDPIAKAFLYARVGNYIDFGAANTVDNNVFLELFNHASMSDNDMFTYEHFLKDCENAKTFLLIADNSGEFVLDKIFLTELKKRFSDLKLIVMVRGGEALNDVTIEDAHYIGMEKIAKIITNGIPMSGTSYELLPQESKEIFDNADVILAKGQGNYETLSHLDRGIYYSFLCKCNYFVEKFGVQKNTGMFIIQ